MHACRCLPSPFYFICFPNEEGGHPPQIRLITEAVPELGRIHGSLTSSPETYSLNGRVWSGAQSLAVVSYGVANNETVKSSHTVTVVTPKLPWSRAELMVEADHLGTLPFNFQVRKTQKSQAFHVSHSAQDAPGAEAKWLRAVSALFG